MNKRLNASSLFETIVALLVTMLVFGIAMTIYVNVLRNSDSLSTFNASLRLDKLAVETKKNKTYFDESFEEENIILEKRVSTYQNKQGLILLELEAKDNTNRILAERMEILAEDQDE